MKLADVPCWVNASTPAFEILEKTYNMWESSLNLTQNHIHLILDRIRSELPIFSSDLEGIKNEIPEMSV